jgi:hypothetical protein
MNIVVLPAELSAAAVLVSYWTPAGAINSTCTSGICNNAMWVGLFLIVVWAINFGGTRVYGEMEFWFCSIKVLTIVGLIILGVIITAGGGPNHEAIGFRYWNETGGFLQFQGIPGAKGRFLAFFSVVISAAFAFIGTEITAIGLSYFYTKLRGKGSWDDVLGGFFYSSGCLDMSSSSLHSQKKVKEAQLILNSCCRSSKSEKDRSSSHKKCLD